MVYSNSRYLSTKLFYRKTAILETRVRYKFTKSLCKIYIFSAGDSLDNLSSKFYGTPYLWFAILDCNPQYLSEIDIEIGDRILVPDFREVATLIE